MADNNLAGNNLAGNNLFHIFFYRLESLSNYIDNFNIYT